MRKENFSIHFFSLFIPLGCVQVSALTVDSIDKQISLMDDRTVFSSFLITIFRQLCKISPLLPFHSSKSSDLISSRRWITIIAFEWAHFMLWAKMVKPPVLEFAQFQNLTALDWRSCRKKTRCVSLPKCPDDNDTSIKCWLKSFTYKEHYNVSLPQECLAMIFEVPLRLAYLKGSWIIFWSDHDA